MLHKIPSKKFSTKRLKPLTYVKYIVLVVLTGLLPDVITNNSRMGEPFFCKYFCPQGILEGGIPLSLTNSGIRDSLGVFFIWKACILGAVIILSIVCYRPFYKWLCPLGAFYSLFNRVSVCRHTLDRSKCISCGKCSRACRMDVDVIYSPNHSECIRCGDCIKACPAKAITLEFGLDIKSKSKKTQ